MYKTNDSAFIWQTDRRIMDKTSAIAKLKTFSQEHVINYLNALGSTEENELIEQIESTDFSVITDSLGKSDKNDNEACDEIAPIKALQLDEIAAKKSIYLEEGTKIIKQGQLGVVLLAGGMGTRLGSDNPKGMYDIGITRHVYIFERIISNLMDVTTSVGKDIHLFIMTSDKNNDATVKFFNEQNFFGYNKEYIHFFKQDMAPATDYNGKVFMESESHIATSPNGNGGWFISIVKAGLDSVINDNNIKWLNVFAVDNVLQRIADPIFLGATSIAGCKCGSKVVKKANPDEKVGVMCLKNSHPSIIEYYELTDQLKNTTDENNEPAYNFGVILNYIFDVDSLKNMSSSKLPWHVVNKKIPYIDDNGNLVKPEEPNGYKFETLILDMVEKMDNCLPFEVVRNHEFAPVKNKTGVDSIESAQKLLKENGIEI